ncbi:putative D-amino-acid oxidase [Streptomyces sp. RB5]|uniref:D-amino-acid oxidase n=1 Tax=Streptomyces smaragdinus TaxID=2585196 RepID=A0A7K0CAX9_9ACTN|nr:FAD-dependent oxidoreductase [Streptomyces smaragdinus]MQY10556.1 putative D-amino-acid oxidase [Streptomyces smaragdinus]
MTDVIVIGSGIVGLTSAVRLAEAGHDVAVWTREPAEATTSAVAGGLWWPYRIEPAGLVTRWGLRAMDVFREQAERPEETGVRMVVGTEAGAGFEDTGPWARELEGLREALPEELPPSFGRGLRARVPLVDVPFHLGWLRRRLEAAGGRVEDRMAASLAEPRASVVVNCAGLGARELAGDESVAPVRGQILVVENPGVEEWLVAADPRETETTYLLPQPYGLVLGGTADEDAWDRTPDPATAEAIVARCARFVPEVASARVLAHKVGLRPARPAVRLEAEDTADGTRVVHNYGHGGAGVTVAWGCADEVVRLVG